MAHSLAESRPFKSDGRQTLISLLFKFCLSAALFFYLCFNQSGDIDASKASPLSEQSTSGTTTKIAMQLFWIGMFSLIAKAALSISYGDDNSNPLHCKIMCLIGLAYCAFVDSKLFSFAFEPVQIGLGATMTVLTLIILAVNAKMHERLKQDLA